MSRESKISPPATAATHLDASDDTIRLEVNLRLRLDEVAETEAEALKRKALRAPTRKDLCRLACRIYDARRVRDRLIDRALFGEPAWDMMLALYCLPTRGERLTITALTHAANQASATGHRWQKILTDEGLIERGPPEVDARKQFVRLTAEGRRLMDQYLTRLFYCDCPVPPHPEWAGG